MAAPGDITATSLATEALIMAGENNPGQNNSLIERYKTTGLQRIFNYIVNTASRNGVSRMKTLQSDTAIVCVVGQRIYNSLPTDYKSIKSITLYFGDHTGTATAGAASSVTLAADEDVSSSLADYIYMTSGTSAGQLREISSLDTSTKIATVSVSWDTQPIAGDGYRVLDEQYYLVAAPTDNPQFEDYRVISDLPQTYSIFERNLYLNVKPDKAYVMYVRYYVKPNTINLTEGTTTLITSIYNNWQDVLEKGIVARRHRELGDPEYQLSRQDYEAAVFDLIREEKVPVGVTGYMEPAFDCVIK